MAVRAGVAPSDGDGNLRSDLKQLRRELDRVDRSESVIFSSVGASVVDPAQRRIARIALRVAADTLGLDDPPSLNWFDVENDGETEYAARYGWRDWEWFPGDPRLMGVYVEPMHEVWVRRGLDDASTLRTVAHEVRHAVRDGMSREVREADAEAFADAIELMFTTPSAN